MPSTDEPSAVCVDRLDLAELLDYVGHDLQDGLVDVPPAVTAAHARLSDELAD